MKRQTAYLIRLDAKEVLSTIILVIPPDDRETGKRRSWLSWGGVLKINKVIFFTPQKKKKIQIPFRPSRKGILLLSASDLIVRAPVVEMAPCDSGATDTQGCFSKPSEEEGSLCESFS